MAKPSDFQAKRVIPEPVILGPCTLYHADCMDVVPMLDLSDLVITSPPYDNLREYGGNGTFDWQSTIEVVSHTIVSGGVVMWNVGDAIVDGSESGSSFRHALWFLKCGLSLHDTMIYEKPNFSNPSHNRYHQLFEFMFVFSKGTPKTFNPICDKRNLYGVCFGKNTFRQADGSMKERKKNTPREFGMRGNVWRINTVGQENMCNSLPHPAMMPLRMASDHILSWSASKEIVLDPMMGSGTTGIACIRTGRKFIGIEIDKGYFDIACDRIRRELDQLTLPLEISEKTSCADREIALI